MARLRRVIVDDSEDELPDLTTLLRKCSVAVPDTPARKAWKERSASPSTTAPRCSLARRKESPDHEKAKNSCWVQNYERQKGKASSPLKSTDANIQRSSDDHGLSIYTRKVSLELSSSYIQSSKRSSPRQAAKAPINYSLFATEGILDDLYASDDEDPFTDLSGFIVSDSESLDGDEVLQTKPKAEIQSPQRASTRSSPTKWNSRNQGVLLHQASTRIDLTSPRRQISDSQKSSEGDDENPTEKPKRPTSQNMKDLEDRLAILRFSPPRLKSPHKSEDIQKLVTPPSSPSKSILQSPSKKNTHIPPTPHRPSIDAFWSQEVINDWNDQYSPRKTPKSTHRNGLIVNDSDPENLLRSPSKSPTKRDKTSASTRKAFDAVKHAIAASFLAEVDNTITGGRVGQLSAETGGIKLVWSKKLNSTAGRANWRREAIRHRFDLDGIVTAPITYRHHASIELAEKVINDENRLINVIAHEYCHLANFMISGVKDNPHGKEFKVWAAKCTAAFEDRGVEVTTKHTYEIDYKYVWVCERGGCGTEYSRHSRSIDPKKHSCGKCKGKLVQIKPVPRKGGEGVKKSEYQIFVKEEYERVKKQSPDKGFGEIMAVLGREFRERKKVMPTDVGSKEKVADEVETAANSDVLRRLGDLALAA